MATFSRSQPSQDQRGIARGRGQARLSSSFLPGCGNKGKYERLLTARPFKGHKGSCQRRQDGEKRARYIDRTENTRPRNGDSPRYLLPAARRKKHARLSESPRISRLGEFIRVQSSIDIRESSRSPGLLSRRQLVQVVLSLSLCFVSEGNLRRHLPERIATHKLHVMVIAGWRKKWETERR